MIEIWIFFFLILRETLKNLISEENTIIYKVNDSR